MPITHLQPEATYHYRIAATNTFGTTYGTDKPFLVPPAVKGVTTEPATEVKTTEATLNGKLDPDGLNTEYHFQYGLNTEYGQNTPLSVPARLQVRYLCHLRPSPVCCPITNTIFAW